MSRIHAHLPKHPAAWLAAVWVAEVFIIQALTLGYEESTPLWRELLSALWRFGLDLLGMTSVVLITPRVPLVMAQVGWFFFAGLVYTYHALFERALTWSTISTQLLDGVDGIGFDSSYVTNVFFLAILVCLIVKVLLVVASPKRLWLDRRRFRWGLLLAGLYLAVAAVGISLVDPLTKLRRFQSVDRLAATHGYLLTWLGERQVLRPSDLLSDALERARLQDRSLTEAFGALNVIPPPHVVMIQVESLDWRALGHTIDGEPFLPFVDSLRASSILLRTRAVHDNGSGDADFVWLTGHLPSRQIITYKLADYPYSNTLADKARDAGFTSTFVHGNSGLFFDRRAAISRMRFDHTEFAEELIQAGLPESVWGVSDFDVLAHVADRFTHAPSRQLALVVSLTSHQPFVYLPRDAPHRPADSDPISVRYFASMRYVDDALRSFYQRLPDGALLVLFGDHRAMLSYSPSDPAFDVRGELVPTILHQKASNLRLRQAIPEPFVESNMLAVASWVHDWLSSQSPPFARSASPRREHAN